MILIPGLCVSRPVFKGNNCVFTDIQPTRFNAQPDTEGILQLEVKLVLPVIIE